MCSFVFYKISYCWALGCLEGLITQRRRESDSYDNLQLYAEFQYPFQVFNSSISPLTLTIIKNDKKPPNPKNFNSMGIHSTEIKKKYISIKPERGTKNHVSINSTETNKSNGSPHFISSHPHSPSIIHQSV